jgi:glutathione S-transferase
MAFKLHGYNISTCTRRVAQIAKERNIPYELVSIDLPSGEHKQQAHVAHQPFGQVPYITVSHPSISYTHCISFV